MHGPFHSQTVSNLMANRYPWLSGERQSSAAAAARETWNPEAIGHGRRLLERLVRD